MEEPARVCSMFELTKWYADAVSATGEFWIGYRARLRYGGLSLHYSSILDGKGQRHSLRRGGLAAPGARWQSAWPPVRAVLYRSPDGVIDWRCLVPGGPASVAGVDGFGYAERLRLTIPPWRLPIRTLRWGRFISAQRSLVWIDWDGDSTCRAVFLNGRPAIAVRIDDGEVELADGTRAIFDRGLVVRSGSLGRTVLGAIPGLRRAAPARIFQVDECKWRSRTTVSGPDGASEEGWSIHEVVRWP